MRLPSIKCGNKVLDLSTPRIMGILNLTPDSFYDGGRFSSKDLAIERVATMLAEGADIIDIGAESAKPYAKQISLQEEIDRIMAVLTAVKSRFDTIISVDTYKPQVMQEAIKVGAHLINDIYALQHEGALEEMMASEVGICLMHMQGTPDTMQNNPTYQDVLTEVHDFLAGRVNACLMKGITADRLLIDPGFGFGKTTVHNMQLLYNLSSLKTINLPIMVGFSRKASIGEILSLPVEDRLFGSIAAHVIAAMQGAAIIRTHDIKPTAEALKIANAVLSKGTLPCQ